MVTPTRTEAIPGEPADWELLASSRRRAVLTVLTEERSVTVETLAAEVLARETGTDVEDVPDRLRDDVKIDLAHVHLPKLDGADAISYDAEESVVTHEVHSIHDSPIVRPDSDESASEAICTALADERRQVVLSILHEQESLLVDEVAARVAARDEERTVEDVPDESVRTVHASLHHSHLPTLEDARFVAWDRDEDRVSLVEDLSDPLTVGVDARTSRISTPGHSET